MADPLSLLRQYYVNKREIVEKNGMICFGEYCWAKNVKTNYLIYSSSRDGPNKSYYTLECLLYFLKNIQLQHPTYVKQAASLDIPVVQRPDRKDLLAYLSGETAVSTSIDKSAPIELPKSASQLNKESAWNQHVSGAGSSFIPGSAGGLSFGGAGAHGEDDGPSASKLARLDEMEKVRKQFVARLDAPKIKKPLVPSDLSALLGGNLDDGPGSSIRDTLSSDQIAALKAKRLAKKRSTIIDADTDMDAGVGTGLNNTNSVHSVLLQFDSNFTKEIQNKERVWRNRSNILQSTGKNFQKTIFPMLQIIKVREEGGGAMRKPGAPLGIVRGPLIPAVGGVNSVAKPGALPVAGAVAGGPPGGAQQYNRYDQERFAKTDVKESIGFNIDTTSTYHGLTLKSVTEGSAAQQPKTPLSGSNALQNGSDSGHRSNGAVAQGPPKPQKRVSRTPIIIIPATNTSLITMFNAKAILQDLKFMDSKVCDQRRDNEVLIQRRKADNSTVPYRIVDNPLKLAPDDWNRVVAVFVQGPAWQFKGWPWDGNPVEIFARIKAFHLKFDEMKLDNNVAKWSVEIIELSRSKRHLDRANLLKFWSLLDGHIAKHKHNIVRY